MATRAPRVARLHTAGSQRARWLGIAAILIGLLLTPATGVIVRFAVAHQGQSVVSWEKGISIVWRVTVFAVLPWFLLLAWLATRSLRSTLAKNRTRFLARRAGWIGALTGQTLFVAVILLGLWPDTHFLGINMLLQLPQCLILTGVPAMGGALLGGAVGYRIGFLLRL